MELNAEELGPTTRMTMVAPGPRGEVAYRIEGRPARRMFLSPSLAGHVLGVIDQTTCVAFVDLQANALVALAISSPGGMRVVSMGKEWGTWQDEGGSAWQSDAPDDLLDEWHAPVAIQSFKQEVSIDFTINVFARNLFEEDARCFFQDDGDLRHMLAIIFAYPSGRYVAARLTQFSKRTGKLIKAAELDAFPLAWPDPAQATQGGDAPQPSAPPPPRYRPATRQPSASPPASASSSQPEAPQERRQPRPARRPTTTPPPPPSRLDQPPAAPAAGLMPTAHDRDFAPEVEPAMPTFVPAEPLEPSEPPVRHQRLTPPPATPLVPMPSSALTPTFMMMSPTEPPPAFSPSPDQRRVRPARRIDPITLAPQASFAGLAREPHVSDALGNAIEACLDSGHSDHVYATLLNMGEATAAVVRNWTPTRLRRAFASQPATLLFPVMQRLTIDQVMAVAESCAEPDQMLDWLRDREAERLRHLRAAARESMTPEAARSILNVRADAEPKDVEIAWQTLRAFLTVWRTQGKARVLERFQRQALALLDRAKEVLLGS